MSYFVTGGTGFIGHNLIELLLQRRRRREEVLEAIENLTGKGL